MPLYKRNQAMSRRMRRFIFILCITILALLVFLDNSYFRHKWQPGSKSQTQTQNSDFEKYHSKNFTVIKVVDGDTLDIDHADDQSSYTRIRLLGIDAPEVNSESGSMYFSAQATDFTEKTVLGKQVTIYLDEGNDTRGKYGRLLAYLKLSDGKFLNEIMVTEGFAYADTRFRHSFYNKYNQLQSRARSNKKGLWKNVTPDQMPQWMQQKESN